MFGQGRRVHGVDVFRCHAIGQDLQCTDAVPADLGKQVEGVGGPGTKAARGPGTDLLAVRQQVVEVRPDNFAASVSSL